MWELKVKRHKQLVIRIGGSTGLFYQAILANVTLSDASLYVEISLFRSICTYKEIIQEVSYGMTMKYQFITRLTSSVVVFLVEIRMWTLIHKNIQNDT